MAELILKDEVYEVVGAAMEVKRVLGVGFLEGVYQDAMQLELTARGVPFEAEKPIDVKYKGQCLTHRYFADLVCFDQVIVELKALSRLSGTEESQVLNYLKATRYKVGVLINFGSPGKLEWKRFANTQAADQ